MVKENYLNVLGPIWHHLRPAEDVSGVRIAVNEAYLVDHVIEGLRDQFGTSF
jgi:hypothetical protein